jgi:hypothetical protein
MPIIDLDGSPLDQHRVLSLMYFPRDELLRNQYFELNLMSQNLLDLEDEVVCNVTAGDLRLLINAPPLNEIRDKVSEAAKRATSAADVLACVYLMEKFKDKVNAFSEPSLNRAFHVAKEFAIKAKFGDGEVPPRSEATIRKNWEEFRPVAHLWAAFRINIGYPFANKADFFRTPESFHKFLGVAAGIFSFGTAFVPSRAKPANPILDQGTAWVVPPSIEPLSLVSDRVPDLLKDYLSHYKA